MSKEVIIIAGANGTGKSTFAKRYLSIYPMEWLNADEIAATINPENPQNAQKETGRIYFKKLNSFLNEGKSFMVESTLSGILMRNWISKFKDAGYTITINYLFLDQPENCITRIRERVKQGGHFVPDKDVKRRFWRSRKNFWRFYRGLADEWFMFYNPDAQEPVASGDKSNIDVIDTKKFELFKQGITDD